MSKKVFRDVKSFKIVRKNWLRGSGDNSALFRAEDEKMCCLGFYAKACGIAQKHIINMPTPEDVTSNLKDIDGRWDTCLLDLFWNTKLTNELMSINDNKKLSDQKREEKITAKFAKAGIKVKFANK